MTREQIIISHHAQTDNNGIKMYEYYWGMDSNDVHGPYPVEAMIEWASKGYFDNNQTWIREVGLHGMFVPYNIDIFC